MMTRGLAVPSHTVFGLGGENHDVPSTILCQF